MDDDDREFEELAQGSMKDLVMKMDDIDKQLEEITGMQTSTSNSKVFADSDRDFYCDEEALTDLKAELQEAQESAIPPIQEVPEEHHEAEDSEAPQEETTKSVTVQLEETKEEVVAETKEAEEPVPPQIEEPSSNRSSRTTISATVVKPMPTSVLGISMKTVGGITRIVGIDQNGLLASTKLRPGLEMVRVNDTYIKNAKHARLLIQKAADKVSLETRLLEEEVVEAKEE